MAPALVAQLPAPYGKKYHKSICVNCGLRARLLSTPSPCEVDLK